MTFGIYLYKPDSPLLNSNDFMINNLRAVTLVANLVSWSLGTSHTRLASSLICHPQGTVYRRCIGIFRQAQANHSTGKKIHDDHQIAAAISCLDIRNIPCLAPVRRTDIRADSAGMYVLDGHFRTDVFRAGNRVVVTNLAAIVNRSASRTSRAR